MQSVMMENMVD